MKHQNNPVQLPELSPQLIIKDVYSIIDSRIQYIEYQAHCRLRNSIKNNSHQDLSSENSASPSCSTSIILANNLDQMLSFVSGLERPLKLLQILRIWLREDNLALIMSLLYNNTYLKYSGDHLEEMLKEEAINALA